MFLRSASAWSRLTCCTDEKVRCCDSLSSSPWRLGWCGVDFARWIALHIGFSVLHTHCFCDTSDNFSSQEWGMQYTIIVLTWRNTAKNVIVLNLLDLCWLALFLPWPFFWIVVFIAFLSATWLCIPLTSLTYVHESPAQLYMPQLFTRCLPTIICVNDYYV